MVSEEDRNGVKCERSERTRLVERTRVPLAYNSVRVHLEFLNSYTPVLGLEGEIVETAEGHELNPDGTLPTSVTASNGVGTIVRWILTGGPTGGAKVSAL